MEEDNVHLPVRQTSSSRMTSHIDYTVVTRLGTLTTGWCDNICRNYNYNWSWFQQSFGFIHPSLVMGILLTTQVTATMQHEQCVIMCLVV